MIEPAPADETGSAAAKLSDSYLAEMLRIRATISRQSATLRQLGTLTADPSRAHRVRDELARAADAIAVLSPPLELDTAHEDFLEGTRELVRGFDELLEAGAALDAPRAHRVQRHIAEAASRFKRGADQFALQKADAVSLEEEMTMRPERAVLTDTSPDRGSGAPDPQSPAPSAQPLRGGGVALLAGTNLNEQALALEIETSWAQTRGEVYQVLDRSVRQAFAAALLRSRELWHRLEDEARLVHERLTRERAQLIAEIEDLRAEAEALRQDVTRTRDELEEAERLRAAAEGVRIAILRDAKARKARLLAEIGELGRQIEDMRQSIDSLLSGDSGSSWSRAETLQPPARQAIPPPANGAASPPASEPAAVSPALPALPGGPESPIPNLHPPGDDVAPDGGDDLPAGTGALDALSGLDALLGPTGHTDEESGPSPEGLPFAIGSDDFGTTLAGPGLDQETDSASAAEVASGETDPGDWPPFPDDAFVRGMTEPAATVEPEPPPEPTPPPRSASGVGEQPDQSAPSRAESRADAPGRAPVISPPEGSSESSFPARFGQVSTPPTGGSELTPAPQPPVVPRRPTSGAATPIVSPPAAPTPVARTEEPSTAAGISGPVSTNVRITRLANLAEGMQIRKAIKAIPGVRALSFPQFREGTMTMTVRHDRGLTLIDEVLAIRETKLRLVGDRSIEEIALEVQS